MKQNREQGYQNILANCLVKIYLRFIENLDSEQFDGDINLIIMMIIYLKYFWFVSINISINFLSWMAKQESEFVTRILFLLS